MVKSESVLNVSIMYQAFSLHKQPHRIIDIRPNCIKSLIFFVNWKPNIVLVTFQYLNHALFAKVWTIFEKIVITYSCCYSQIYLNPLGWRLILCTPTVFVRKVNPGILFTAFLIPLFGIRGRRCNLPVLDCARYHAQRAIRHTNWNIKIDFWEGKRNPLWLNLARLSVVKT